MLAQYSSYPQLLIVQAKIQKYYIQNIINQQIQQMSCNYHYLFKFVVAGDAGVGKSTLIQQFTEETHRNTYIPTQRIHFASKIISVSDLQVKCQLWDMKQPADPQKHDGFTGLADSLCKKAAAVLLLFDLTSKASFEGVERWVQDIRAKCDENITIVLIGNKTDKEERVVNSEEAEQYSRQANITYFEVSSFDHKAITLLFEKVVKSILDKISLKNQNEQVSELKSKIKRGKMQIQAPASPINSSNDDKQKEKSWFDDMKTEDSEQVFSVIQKLTDSLKKTCFLEEMLKKIKGNIRQKGLYYLRQLKDQMGSSKIAQSSTIVKDLFEIFSIIQESSTEQHITLSRISLENEELIKYREVQSQISKDQLKIEQLEKKIETLNAQKSKLEQYKEKSEGREKELLFLIDKMKKQKKVEIQKNAKLMKDLAKLEQQNLEITKQLNRLKDEEEEQNVQKLIQARENSQIIQQLENLEESGVDSDLIGKLKNKLSARNSLTNSYHEIQPEAII